MDNKILEILLDMQKGMKDMQNEIKGVQNEIKGMKEEIKGMKEELKDTNNRLDKIEFKMADGFETLEILSENNSLEINKVKTKVSKLEKRVLEINIVKN